jgi:hypothetical protein
MTVGCWRGLAQEHGCALLWHLVRDDEGAQAQAVIECGALQLAVQALRTVREPLSTDALN